MKIMKLLENKEEMDIEDEDVVLEKVNDFQYLRSTLGVKNDWSKKIGIKIAKAERASFARSKFLKLNCFSKKKQRQGCIRRK